MPASKILLTIKTDTKEEETEILAAFLTRLQYSPTSITPSESPDFEILLSENLVGIEVTKYYSDFTKKGSKTQRFSKTYFSKSAMMRGKSRLVRQKYIFLRTSFMRLWF